MEFISGFLIGGSIFFIIGAWAEWRVSRKEKERVDQYYDKDLSYLLRRQGE